MVDTREGEVAEADLPYAFDKQPPLKRIAIVVAGPLVNLILAVLLYVASFNLYGVTEVKPWVGTVESDSLAAKSGFQVGDRITSINGKAVHDWMDAQTELVIALQAGNVTVGVQDAQGVATARIMDVEANPASVDAATQGQGVGIWPIKVKSEISQVLPNSAAERAGLKAGDKVIAVNGQKLLGWKDWVDVIKASPGKDLRLDVQRQGQMLSLMLRPDSEDKGQQLEGKAGVAASIDNDWEAQVKTQREVGIGESVVLAAQKTWNLSALTLKFLGKLIMGEASIKGISGPVSIGEMAGKSAMMGLETYIQFLAVISISLGVMNLLPIPVLDGGHLLYYIIEWVRGKPLSEHVQTVGLKIGLCIMGLFMLVAFFNDFTRIFG